ncbi:MAG: cyclic nucleotide-binding domain-containing protein [Verrucomicrobiales bacterium]
MRYLTGYLLADRILAKSSCRREFRAGEMVFREGDRSDAMFIVASGKVVIFKSGDGGESKLAEVGPMGVFGELGYFAGEPRSASLRAKGEVVHSYFSGFEFEEIEDSDPERALEMLFAVARALVGMLR